MSRATATVGIGNGAAASLWVVRVAAIVLTALFVAQALTGGDYLVGNEDAMDLHGPGAITIHVIAGIQAIAAALLWWATRGPWWPAVLSAAVFGLSFLQARLGASDTLDAHIPLAMTLLIAVMLVLSWAWSPGRAG